MEEGRRHERKRLGAPCVVVEQAQHSGVPDNIPDPGVELLLQGERQVRALDVLPIEREVEQPHALVRRRAAEDGREDLARIGWGVHRREAEDGDAAEPCHDVRGEDLPDGSDAEGPAKLDQTVTVGAAVEVQVLEEHHLRQRRPVDHLGGVHDQGSQQSGQDEAAERDGKGGQDGGGGRDGAVVEEPFDGVDFHSGETVVTGRGDEGRDDVLLDLERLSKVEEA
ncbi:hypothetical protein VFPFJ_00913 [Purpureocillium lilacinum]|uniref:Uncharacterized protein n=1 Tax=Purpureocillium lilacinum TaxID=33203 RepID=A0A179HXR5_PURLI|nr:hypothetical protein VFPFJ_00913 [Purpureocillium lilacinum]OAQ94804.1 hypothetical protein VFPFJ_00913 [Purpureocillium lilacinum]